jgi:hypothetical protein
MKTVKQRKFFYYQKKVFQHVQEWQPNIIIIEPVTNGKRPYNWKCIDEYMSDYIALAKSVKEILSQPIVYVFFLFM